MSARVFMPPRIVTIYLVVEQDGELACINGQVCGYTDRERAEADAADIRRHGGDARVIEDNRLTEALTRAWLEVT